MLNILLRQYLSSRTFVELFASRFIRHLKFKASILRLLTSGILNLSSSVDSRNPNLRDAIRTTRKPRNRSYTYWKNLPITHSHFRTEIMLKIREHTSPSDTGINFHCNDWNCTYYQVIWWRNSEDWDETFKRRIPQPRAALFSNSTWQRRLLECSFSNRKCGKHGMICWVLAMEMMQGVWKQDLRPRTVVGYGVKIFLPSPPNYVTRSPGIEGRSIPVYE